MIFRKKNIYTVSVVIMLLSTAMCSSCRSAADSIKYNGRIYSDGDMIEVSGRISRIGNEPFTSLVVIDSSGERFQLPSGTDEFELKPGANVIKIKGVLRLKKLVTADGKKTAVIREIVPERAE